MVNLKRLVGVILLVTAGYFIMSCDDFFKPTIEIFNKLENTTSIEQDHGQNQEDNKVQVNQQQF